jgi:predicted class III extradiol MEMO1 family dioxygenase
MIKGIDEEDRTREQEMLTLGEALHAERQMLKDSVAKEVLNEVDLSYHYLTNDAFFNVLPVIEVNYFLSI